MHFALARERLAVALLQLSQVEWGRGDLPAARAEGAEFVALIEKAKGVGSREYVRAVHEMANIPPPIELS
jgi:hypothetical protein